MRLFGYRCSNLTAYDYRATAGDTLIKDSNAKAVARRKRAKARLKAATYDSPLVVFLGLLPGVYSTLAEALPQVKKIPWGVVLHYRSRSDALEAFEYALHRGWVRKFHGDRWTEMRVPSLAAFATSEFTNPVSVGLLRRRWYCVYRGVAPGVYGSMWVPFSFL